MEPGARVGLGRTGLSVTRLGLGTAALGNLLAEVGDDEAAAVVDRAWDLGVRLFDTAPLYGHGLAERRLGAGLQGRSRDDYVLATKVGRLLVRGAPRDPTQWVGGEPFYRGVDHDLNPVRDWTADGVRRSLAASLERMGLDRVDVLHVHDPDDHQDVALRETIPAAVRLRDEGVIRAVSVGMNQAPALARFVREADLDAVLVAGRTTLLDQSGYDELLPLCAERGVAVLVGGVYNSGVLARPDGGAHYDYVPAAPEVVARARALAAVCARHGVPLTAAAIQFPFGHPAVTAVLAGARSVAELDESAAALRTPIPADLWAELRADRLLPEEVATPRGEGARSAAEGAGAPPSRSWALGDDAVDASGRGSG